MWNISRRGLERSFCHNWSVLIWVWSLCVTKKFLLIYHCFFVLQEHELEDEDVVQIIKKVWLSILCYHNYKIKWYRAHNFMPSSWSFMFRCSFLLWVSHFLWADTTQGILLWKLGGKPVVGGHAIFWICCWIWPSYGLNLWKNINLCILLWSVFHESGGCLCKSLKAAQLYRFLTTFELYASHLIAPSVIYKWCMNNVVSIRLP